MRILQVNLPKITAEMPTIVITDLTLKKICKKTKSIIPVHEKHIPIKKHSPIRSSEESLFFLTNRNDLSLLWCQGRVWRGHLLNNMDTVEWIKRYWMPPRRMFGDNNRSGSSDSQDGYSCFKSTIGTVFYANNDLPISH